MSHLIMEGIDTVYTPAETEWEHTWHGLQTSVNGRIEPDGSNIPEVFCPVVECGMKPDFDAEISTVKVEDQEDIGLQLKDWKLILADCRKGKSGKVLPLHIPKKGYKVHQNLDLYKAMVGAANEVCGQDGFQIVTVGTLGAYSQFFVSVAIKGQESFEVGTMANGVKDVWKRFFNLNSSHNGLIASNRMLSFVRIVCMNTVQASIQDAEGNGTISAIKHCQNSEDLITAKVFAKDLQTWIEQGERVKLMLEAIKAEPMSLDGFRAFASGVFTNEKSDELSTNSFNRVNDMASLFSKGQGNNGETRYDGLNAFTEFFTSGRGVGSSDTVKLNKRIASANFGRGNDWKLEALRVATNEEVFASTVKRGELLYADKAKEQAASN